MIASKPGLLAFITKPFDPFPLAAIVAELAPGPLAGGRPLDPPLWGRVDTWHAGAANRTSCLGSPMDQGPLFLPHEGGLG